MGELGPLPGAGAGRDDAVRPDDRGILQGTYETFAELALQHFGGTLRGRVVLIAGLGGMGGAQPLSVTMNDGVCIAIEVDEARARRRHEIGYVDRFTDASQDALVMARRAAKASEAFDVVTDQTSAHDALGGYIPAEMTFNDARILRETQPAEYEVRAMLAFQAAGAVVFDYGNNRRVQAQETGVEHAFDYPGFVPAFIRPQFCEGRGPFRWAALFGDPEDIRVTDRAILKLFPRDAS